MPLLHHGCRRARRLASLSLRTSSCGLGFSPSYKNMSDWIVVVPAVLQESNDYTVQRSFDIPSSGRRGNDTAACWLQGGMNEIEGAVACRREEYQCRSRLCGRCINGR